MKGFHKFPALGLCAMLMLSFAGCGSSDIGPAMPREIESGNTLATDMIFLDGMWQNAAGEAIAISAALIEYSAYYAGRSASGTVRDAQEGMGLYLYDYEGNAYICPSADGSSFTISDGFPNASAPTATLTVFSTGTEI